MLNYKQLRWIVLYNTHFSKCLRISTKEIISTTSYSNNQQSFLAALDEAD